MLKILSVKGIIKRHTNFFLQNFGLSSTENNGRLPNIYWLPKLHKSPIKFRFIIAAPECSIKPLARVVTSVFKLCQRQICKHNKISSFFSGIKTSWVIDNNIPVLEAAYKLSRRRQAQSLETFDFSTLYTKIPHDKLTTVLCKLVDFYFKGGAHQYLLVNKWGAKWAADPDSYSTVYDKTKIKLAIRYLMGNCYFLFGNGVFKQDTGKPMVSDPAAFSGNLFLFYFEDK